MKLDGKKVSLYVWWHRKGRWIFAYTIHISALVMSLIALGVNIYVRSALK